MRTADAIEKVTLRKPEYLLKYKPELLQLLTTADNIEFKWHLAQLIPRLELTEHELANAWLCLTAWATDQRESKIVRVNALQALFDLLQFEPGLLATYEAILAQVETEHVPSINARLKKIRKSMP